MKTYYEVCKCSQNAKIRLFVTESVESARNFCEQNHWQLTDENELVWDLDYCRINDKISP